jgi:hypothetical protein
MLLINDALDYLDQGTVSLARCALPLPVSRCLLPVARCPLPVEAHA